MTLVRQGRAENLCEYFGNLLGRGGEAAEVCVHDVVRQGHGPAHVALEALAERFPRDTDLNRAEARIAADSGSDGLVDECAARAVAGERGTACGAPHRL